MKRNGAIWKETIKCPWIWAISSFSCSISSGSFVKDSEFTSRGLTLTRAATLIGSQVVYDSRRQMNLCERWMSDFTIKSSRLRLGSITLTHSCKLQTRYSFHFSTSNFVTMTLPSASKKSHGPNVDGMRDSLRQDLLLFETKTRKISIIHESNTTFIQHFWWANKYLQFFLLPDFKKLFLLPSYSWEICRTTRQNQTCTGFYYERSPFSIMKISISCIPIMYCFLLSWKKEFGWSQSFNL